MTKKATLTAVADRVTRSRDGMDLSRLEEGSYGHCFDCGDEIAEPRLRARPFVELGTVDGHLEWLLPLAGAIDAEP
jgi:RNA polymerase-binding transcription factor DksA